MTTIFKRKRDDDVSNSLNSLKRLKIMHNTVDTDLDIIHKFEHRFSNIEQQANEINQNICSIKKQLNDINILINRMNKLLGLGTISDEGCYSYIS